MSSSVVTNSSAYREKGTVDVVPVELPVASTLIGLATDRSAEDVLNRGQTLGLFVRTEPPSGTVDPLPHSERVTQHDF
jgi:hypothetical protein